MHANQDESRYQLVTLCVVCPVLRPAGKPRQPNFAPVCDGCRTQVRAELVEIPDLYALIPQSLEPGTGTGVKVSGTRTPPLPLALNPLNLLVAGGTGPVHDPYGDQHGAIPPIVVLDQWVADWIDWRDRDEHQPVPTITTLTSWLLNRLDWAMDQHPAVDEFAREVHGVRRTIIGVLDLRRHINRLPAPCPTCELSTLFRMDGASYVECKSCGRLWTEEDYRRLCVILAAEQDAA